MTSLIRDTCATYMTLLMQIGGNKVAATSRVGFSGCQIWMFSVIRRAANRLNMAVCLFPFHCIPIDRLAVLPRIYCPVKSASVTLPRGPGLGPSPRHWVSLARRACVFANRSPAPVVPISAKLSFVCRVIPVLAVNLEGIDFTQHLPATLATRKKMCHCPATYLSFPNTSLHRPLKPQSSKQ